VIENKIVDTCKQILGSPYFISERQFHTAPSWEITEVGVQDFKIDRSCFLVDLTFAVLGRDPSRSPDPITRLEGKAEAIIDDFGDVNYHDITMSPVIEQIGQGPVDASEEF
jgi:hypothetical protein